ncbi:hypothetical protein [uncultured Roseivirga sp.]|uniref:hypothetical protein n=1 Tax=uncultured Roseivirga sp. TaxID=543088 RepID=UPI0030D7D74F|tara:strand:+ start:1230 stop:1445 length:216 start_codon:yes stop_codon:yes gene_type:complete
MRTKLKTISITMLLLIFCSPYLNAGYCIQVGEDNTGWCVEGVDGRGKCIVIHLTNAQPCIGSQPEDLPELE